MLHYAGYIKQKLPHFGTTIFATMNNLANEYDAINLSQGFPDFPVSERLIDLIHQYMQKGYNQYAPMRGVAPLREAICEKIENIYGVNYHPEKEVNISAGATQAIFTAITALVNPGDEVILFPPAFDSYVPSIELNGGLPVPSRLRPPDYSVNWEEVKNLITSKTRMIIINTPHNPTGSVLETRDMQKLEEILRDTDIVVLSDEVYEHMIYDGREHQSLIRFPGLVERSFVMFSFGKTFHGTGFKMGYCLAPENLMAEFRSVHQFLIYCCNTPVQYAMADYLRDKDTYLGISSFYQAKRDYFLDLLHRSRFKFKPSSGSYFQLLDYSEITDEKDIDFAIRLTKEHRLASIPVSVFYPDAVDNHVLRFCFAKKEETLERGAEILCKI